MTKTITATEAKNRLGAVLSGVQRSGEPVIVENRHEPAAVIMTYGDFEELQGYRAERRRHEAIAKIREIQQRVADRNKDLDDEDADRIADEIVREAIDSMIAKGRIRFVEK
jgi:prevent-host-death family protein